MSTQYDLSDAQWCVLDLLMRAREKGAGWVSRSEILYSSSVPDTAKMQLVWGALAMPKPLIQWRAGEQEFGITEEGATLYALRFGSKAKPTAIADSVICLPDMSRRLS